MNIRGKAWCPNCQKEQPASLVGLSIDGDEKKVTGFCSVCEHPVQRSLALKPTKNVDSNLPKEDNCIPLRPKKEPSAPTTETLPSAKSVAEVERPSLITFVALLSFCLVITYLL